MAVSFGGFFAYVRIRGCAKFCIFGRWAVPGNKNDFLWGRSLEVLLRTPFVLVFSRSLLSYCYEEVFRLCFIFFYNSSDFVLFP